MRRLSLGAIVTLVLALVVLGGLGLSGASAASAQGPAAPSSHAVVAAQPAATHGDLVITSGETFVIQPPKLNQTYYQGGNITVETGGTLIVRNTTLSFVQSVPQYGTLSARVAGLYTFDVAGKAYFFNSTITTDAAVLDAYPKLPLTVTGTMGLWNSSLEFPGWVTVTGATADLTLNNSNIRDNPTFVANSSRVWRAIYDDAEYAPVYTQSAGAQAGLFQSAYGNSYADQTPPAVNASFGVGIWSPKTPIADGNYTWSGFPETVAGSEAIVQDWLYPSGYSGGTVSLIYNSNGTGFGSADVSLYFLGNTYGLGTVTFGSDQLGAVASVGLAGTSALAALNAAGRTAFFSGGPSVILSAVSVTPAVNITALNVSLNPSAVSYNLTVTGAGTTLGTVDTSLDLNWASSDVSPSPLPPYDSNKLLVQDGATAYLANLTVPNSYARTASSSAVVPDNTSTVNFYRWAEFDLTGRGGTVPIYGASVHAFSALPSSESNNGTANALADLDGVDPAIWSYVQFHDARAGYPAYGETGTLGTTELLLPSTQLTGPELPDGNFLGNYHIIVVLPIAKNNTSAFNWSVSAYPTGVALNTTGYGMPDFAPTSPFPLYYAQASVITAPTVITNGVPSPGGGVRIGQTLTFHTTLTSIALAPITTINAYLWWNNTTAVATYVAHSVPLTYQGATYNFNISWKVNDTITGLLGTSFNHTFRIQVVWNPGNATGISGSLNVSEGVVVRPSQVYIVAAALPALPGSISLSNSYTTDFYLAYNGTTAASVLLEATPTSGGSPVLLTGNTFLQGNSSLTWSASVLSAGTTYTIALIATYNGVTVTYTVGVTSVPSSTSPTSFLTQKFFGLPLWIWLAIVGAIIVAIVVALMLLRRTAAGKLVECGECGNLIPEDATICPKCGAEFESDLVRCSRCASTIPAASAICPECAAILLGTPADAGEEAERQGYQDFTEKYRAEGKRELGENFNEGSFWDWWKRQPTYVPYNQWKLQQGQGTPRTGMTEPPAAGGYTDETPAAAAPPPRQPPRTGGGAAAAVRPPAAPPPPARPTAAPPPPRAAAPAAAPPAAAPAGAAPAGFKNCPGCGKEIPGDYLICPFCSSVVQ